MKKLAVVPWEKTAVGVFVACPVCRGNKKLLQLDPDTRAENLPVHCRMCKQVSVFNIQAGEGPDRVTLQGVR